MRTDKQNKALNLWCRQVANKCQELGIDQRALFQARSMPVPITEHSIKEIWRSVQHQMYGTDSTTQCEKSQVTKVHEAVMLGMIEHFAEKGLDFIEFPSEDNK